MLKVVSQDRNIHNNRNRGFFPPLLSKTDINLRLFWGNWGDTEKAALLSFQRNHMTDGNESLLSFPPPGSQYRPVEQFREVITARDINQCYSLQKNGKKAKDVKMDVR